MLFWHQMSADIFNREWQLTAGIKMLSVNPSAFWCLTEILFNDKSENNVSKTNKKGKRIWYHMLEGQD